MLQQPENHDPQFFWECWQLMFECNAHRGCPSSRPNWRRPSSSSGTQHCDEKRPLPGFAHDAGLVSVASSSWRRPVEPELDGRPGCGIWRSTYGSRDVGQTSEICERTGELSDDRIGCRDPGDVLERDRCLILKVILRWWRKFKEFISPWDQLTEWP